MQKLLKFCLIFGLSIVALQASAESTDSQGYVLITPAQPTAETDKIEIIEFFWYGCPHCYSFEPTLNKWLKTQADNINFIRIPAIFNKRWGQHAKAFFTAQALGVDEAVHDDLFDAIQNKKLKLQTEDQLVKFFMAHGIEEQAVRDHYNSFLVDAKMRKAKSMAPRYGVRSVPTMIVDGKYKINATIAKGQDKITVVMDQLIATIAAEKQ